MLEFFVTLLTMLNLKLNIVLWITSKRVGSGEFSKRTFSFQNLRGYKKCLMMNSRKLNSFQEK